MNAQPKKIVQVVAMALLFWNATGAYAEETDNIELPAINIEDDADSEVIPSETTGDYLVKKSRTSTKLNLKLKETPQSVSIITQQQLEDFNLTTLADALDLAPSINVERVETDRIYYTSRGFDITNFQIDNLNTSVGAAFGNVQGDIDTVVYDRVEVLRGANGLLTGTGNPSATINFVRKRPTTEFQASVNGQVGSWNRKRAVADISGSLNEAGTVRARVVAAIEDKDGYLDRYGKKREVFYGVVDFQLSDATQLTLGHTYQQDDADSPLWGSLEVAFSDGTPTNFDASDSNAAQWAYWNNGTNTSFVELQTEFDNGWQTKAQLMRENKKSDSELFYTYGALDPVTGAGMIAYPSKYNADIKMYIADVYASGPFTIAGREHELVIGAQWAKTDIDQTSINGDTLGTPLTYETYLDGSSPRPNFSAAPTGGVTNERQRSVYASAKLNFTDALKVIVGGRYTDYSLTEDSYGTVQDYENKQWVPYLGAVYALTERLNVYASYTEIFTPQGETDINRKTLGAIEGDTIEMGLKMDFNDGKALASASIFRTVQDNLAVAAGLIPGSVDAYFDAADGITSKGIELDVQGEVLPGLKLAGGYAFVDIEDANGDQANTFSPKQTFKLASTYQLQSAPKWRVGGTVKWKDDTFGPLVEQSSYSTWDAMVSYQATDNLKASLNVYNIFDKEYLSSVYWAGLFGQAFQGSPRSATVSVKYDF